MKKSALPVFADLNVLIIGDVMVDRYLSGTVDRISPEAPVPVVRVREEENRPGGAANVALNVRALGAEPILLSVVGQDEAGRDFTDELLPGLGISTAGILSSQERRTTLKTRVLAQRQQLLRADFEDTQDLSAREEAALLQRLEKLLTDRPPDVIILQDYNKGVMTAGVIETVMRRAEELGIPTAVDPKDRHFWAYRGATLFKPNLREMQAQLDRPLVPTLAALDDADRLLRERLGNRYSMITLSEHGIYVSDGTESSISPTAARAVADVSGAGDTVISVVACGLARKLPPAELARLANLAAAQVVGKSGVVAVDWAALERV